MYELSYVEFALFCAVLPSGGASGGERERDGRMVIDACDPKNDALIGRLLR